MTHDCALSLREVTYVFVVGCGGTGCAVGAGLPYLHQALRARGGPGLHVTFLDGDQVSETNIVRQPFSLAEVGEYKAEVLASRLNLMWGFDWRARSEYLTAELIKDILEGPSYIFSRSIAIGCVDNRAARKRIARLVTEGHFAYWLDFGNQEQSGQFLLGRPPCWDRDNPLPLPSELYPSLIDASLDEPEDASCSALEALERQQPFVNQTLAAFGLNLLSQLLWGGSIDYHGAFLNFATGETRKLPLDRELWKKIRRHQARVKKAVA